VTALAYLDAMGVSVFARDGVQLIVDAVQSAAVMAPMPDSTQPVAAEPVPVEVVPPSAAIEPEVALDQPEVAVPPLSLDCSQFVVVRLGQSLMIYPATYVESVYTTSEYQRLLIAAMASALMVAPEVEFMPPLSGPQLQHIKTDQHVFDHLYYYLDASMGAGVNRIVLVGAQLASLCALLQDKLSVDTCALLHEELDFAANFISGSDKKRLWQLLIG